MRILELSLSGFGSYSQETTLDLRNVGVCAVTGHNGAGKSTLFDAILWALYGSVPGKAANELVNDGGGPAHVLLTIEAGGASHTFRRERPLGDKAGLAEYSSPGKGVISGSRPVTAEAEYLLNSPRDILALTALSRQGDSGKFGSMDAGRRRTALSVLFAGVFEEPLQLAEDAQTRTVALSIRAARDLAAVEAKAREAAHANRAVEAAQRAVNEVEASLARAEQASTASSGVLDRLQTAETAHRRATRHHREMAQATADAENARIEQEMAEGFLGSAKVEAAQSAAEAEAAAKKAKRSDIDAAIAEKASSDAPERIRMLERGETDCPTCGSDLGQEKINEIVAEQQTLVTESSKAQRLNREVRQVHTQAKRAASTQAKEAEALAKQASLCESQIQQSTKAAVSAKRLWEEAQAEAAGLEELQRLAKNAPDPRILSNARAQHNQAQKDLGKAEKWAEDASQAATELPKAQEAATRSSEEARGVELLKQSLGPSGLPHLALESVMSKLSVCTNDALRHLGHLQVRFVLDDASKANPPLSIEARDGWTAEWRSYGTFSGGERMKMDIALRVGLTRVIGVRCRTMVLDEGWGTLDASASADLARLLMRLILSGGIDAFYTISHVSSAVDEFDHHIEVKRGIHGSKAVLISAA